MHGFLGLGFLGLGLSGEAVECIQSPLRCWLNVLPSEGRLELDSGCLEMQALLSLRG